MNEESNESYEDVFSWITLTSPQGTIERHSYMVTETLHGYRFPKPYDFYYVDESLEIVRTAYRRRAFRAIGTAEVRNRVQGLLYGLPGTDSEINERSSLGCAVSFFGKALAEFLSIEIITVEEHAPSQLVQDLVPLGVKVISSRQADLSFEQTNYYEGKIYIDLLVRSHFFALELRGELAKQQGRELDGESMPSVKALENLLSAKHPENLQGEIMLEYIQRGIT